jgi:hypothetical protein
MEVAESKGSTQADLHTSIPGQLLNTNNLQKFDRPSFTHGRHRDRSDMINVTGHSPHHAWCSSGSLSVIA